MINELLSPVSVFIFYKNIDVNLQPIEGHRNRINGWKLLNFLHRHHPSMWMNRLVKVQECDATMLPEE